MQFSSRTDWTLTPNQLTARLSELEASGAEILDLTESNPTQVGLQYSSDIVLSSLTDSKNLDYQPSPLGLQEARETIAEYYDSKGIYVNSNQILVTASTSEAYSMVFRLIANIGDHILMPRPSYPLFHFLAELNDVELAPYALMYQKGCPSTSIKQQKKNTNEGVGARLISYKTTDSINENESWRIDFEDIRKSFKPKKTRGIVLVNPNNPTGSYIRKDELTKLNQFAEGNQLCIISDEVFSDFQWEKKIEGIPSLAGNQKSLTFTLSGISKILGLPQMKLSWIAVNGPKDLVKQAMERLEIISDTYLSVNTPVQNALHHWMKLKDKMQKQILKRVTANRAMLEKNGQFELLNGEGGWYAVFRLPKSKTEEEWALELLEKDHVLIHPGYFYDFQSEPYAVVSLLPEPSVFEEAISKIAKRIDAQFAEAVNRK